MRRLILTTLLALFVMVPVSNAYLIEYYTDPAVLHIGSPPNTAPHVVGGEFREIDSTGFDILFNPGNPPRFHDPLQLILGVPNQTDLTPLISSLSGSSSTFSGPVFRGLFVQNAHGNAEAYSFLGLNGDNSNNFTNWVAAESSLGITATSFGLFSYDLSGTTFADLINPISVEFAKDLPKGTIAIAYGETWEYTYEKDGVTIKKLTITPYSTPITEAGITIEGGGGTSGGTPVPEPGTLLLLGGGLLALGGYRKYRK